jgi:methyl-accepting chemotaxis protein
MPRASTRRLPSREREAIRAEAEKASGQLRQVRGVLADAVSSITESFATLRAESDAQRHSMSELLSSMASADAGAPQRRRLGAQAFARETGAVLQQFTEMLVGVSRESGRAVERIDQIAAHFDRIFKLVEQVNDISEATLVLAVNASIQAANAKGSHGHSFAVIAANVRDLSRTTQRFNNEIGDEIERARTTIDGARRSMSEMASRDLDVALESKQRVSEMLADAASFEALTRETIERADGAAGQIAAAASSAITALQFQDIAEQILSNVQQRVERVASLASTNGAGASAVPREPAAQTSVAPGDVQLF